MRLLFTVCFSGDCPECDCGAAAEALRAAGFEVHHLPPTVHARIWGLHPLDDYLEVIIDGPPGHEPTPETDKIMDVIWREIDGLVDRFAGTCLECRLINGSYEPFADLLQSLASGPARYILS
jgi:hypothetical protein